MYRFILPIFLFLPGCWQTAEQVATTRAQSASIYLDEASQGKQGKEKLHELIQEGNVIVEFYATWCPPCNMMHPIIDQLADEYKDRIKVVKVDIDQFNDITSDFQVGTNNLTIESVPQFYLFKDGVLKESFKGGKERNILKEMIHNIFELNNHDEGKL